MQCSPCDAGSISEYFISCSLSTQFSEYMWISNILSRRYAYKHRAIHHSALVLFWGLLENDVECDVSGLSRSVSDPTENKPCFNGVWTFSRTLYSRCGWLSYSADLAANRCGTYIWCSIISAAGRNSLSLINVIERKQPVNALALMGCPCLSGNTV